MSSCKAGLQKRNNEANEAIRECRKNSQKKPCVHHRLIYLNVKGVTIFWNGVNPNGNKITTTFEPNLKKALFFIEVYLRAGQQLPLKLG